MWTLDLFNIGIFYVNPMFIEEFIRRESDKVAFRAREGGNFFCILVQQTNDMAKGHFGISVYY